MAKLIQYLLFAGFLAINASLFSATAADSQQARALGEQHLRGQFAGQSEQASIQLGQIDLSRLPECQTMEAFSPPGSSGIGKTVVGIRCLSPARWSVLIPAQIAVTGNYVVTARALIAGQAITGEDLSLRSGDVSQLPVGTLSDPRQAIGKTLRNSLNGGLPLRKEYLMASLLVRQGQTVRVISRGDGFSIQSEGRALNNASDGQVVQVRMPSGQTISGVVHSDGNVEVNF